MIKIYGSPICPHCVALKKSLDEKNKAYEYINITESTKNLKEFLKIRDHSPLYEDAREQGYIGIPTVILEDGTITLDWESLDIDSLADGTGDSRTGSSCDLRTGKC